MRALQRLTIAALLIAALAVPGTGPAAGHDRETRDTREVRDTRDAHETERRDRDADRDRRDAERQRHDRDESKDRSQIARDDKATQDSKDTADSPTGDSAASKSSDSDSDSSDSNSGSSGSNTSGSNTSGSNSGSSGTSGSSGSGSNSGSSNSGSDGGDDNEENSGSNSGSSNSGSDGGDDNEENSGSNSGSSNGGSDDDDDNDDDGDDSDDDRQIAGAGDARRIDLETDAQGRERRRGEFLVRGGREVADALRAAGFRTLSSRHLSNLNASVLRVEVRAGSTMDADIAFARRIAGTDDAEPNYVFRLSGAARTFAGLATAAAQTTAAADTGVRVGVVDTGADGQAPALRNRIAAARGFGGPYTARTHGTYVAQILARENVRVEVADVFQADAQGAPVATAESIARGIDWLATRRIPVVNVSITGPNSGVLSAVVARAIERGTIVVAAAGNDGPAAPPVYPAAFADVVGVTAVDQGGRVYRRANRGQYVEFAALGVRVPVTGASGTVEYVSGTSYAAPLIAAAFARRYTQQRPGGAVAEIARMQNAAIDLGERGRDPVFGWGRVSTSETQR
ncbi:MAG: S8 family serine peptidase [Lysobacter sp.]|nr:S8 family serine peptidase [Lysobacter sp.]